MQVEDVAGAFGSVAYPLGAILFALYPVAILLWTVAEGQAAARALKEADLPSSDEKLDGSAKPKPAQSASAFAPCRRRRWFAAVGVAACAVAVPAAGHALGFIAGGSMVSSPVAAPTAAAAGVVVAEPLMSKDTASYAHPAVGLAVAACLAGLAAAAVQRLRKPPTAAASKLDRFRGRAGRVLRRQADSALTEAGEPSQEARAQSVPRYSAPPHAGISLWHDVQLFVKTWMDEPTDLLRYVNEMPRGCLQKFEVMPHLPGNEIEEDPKGSSRLAAFGQPVPFNYGCFPQTFRDPQALCELSGAPGDDDPLDVLDLCNHTVGVGEVVRCRPLGAVCLIDEGQADWKILAVNVDSSSPLAEACSIEDVERIAPGRVQECLQWIDDFKQSSGKGEAKLHFEVHGVDTALSLIKKDHISWQKLLDSAGPCGTALGHWIRHPEEQSPAPQPVVLKLGWSRQAPRLVAPAQRMETRSALVGAARAATLVRAGSGRGAVTRREPAVAAEVVSEV